MAALQIRPLVSYFFVRGACLQAHAKSGHTDPATKRHKSIGVVIDDVTDAIERDNPQLKGVLPKEYARPSLDKARKGFCKSASLAEIEKHGFVLTLGR